MPFSDMIDQLFNDPVLGKDATYYPLGTGDGYTVRVMTKSPDVISGFGLTRIQSTTLTLEVRVIEVPTPAIGDTFELDGTTYAIQSEPIADRERLVWALDMLPA
jgi:hypothetical protein